MRNLCATSRQVTARANVYGRWNGTLSVLKSERAGSFPRGFRLFKVRDASGLTAALSTEEVNDKLEAVFDAGVVKGVHHVALICEDIERSLAFYVDVLGLVVNPMRPNQKLPYRGAWLDVGTEMIHLMELPNPDPDDVEARPEHGGRDRHFCIGVDEGAIASLCERLDQAGIKYTKSKSGRPAIFFRDPDANCLEVVELADWR